MKISKMFTVLAAVALLAGLAGCSSDDNPVVPAGGSGSSGPSVTIVGPNEMAADSVTGSNVTKSIQLSAYTTGWADDAQVRYGWAISDDNGKTYGNSSVHVTVSATTNTPSITLTAKNGDSSVTADAPQTVTVGVNVYKYDADATKQAANLAAGIKYSFKVTVKASQPELKFIRWEPDYDFVTTTGTAGVYKKAPALDAVNPGESLYFVPPTPIYNGYSANVGGLSVEYKKGWTYTTSNKAIALIKVGSAEQTEASYPDTTGTANVTAKAVNKTEADATVTLTVSGNYILSETVKPSFNKTVTRKINKGKKVKVTLTTSDPATFKYGDAAAAASKVLDDVWAGLAYETLSIVDGAEPTAKHIVDTTESISALTGNATVVSTNKYKFTVTYLNAPTAFDLPIKWEDN